MPKDVKVVVFSGGRGTSTICDALKRHPQIELTVLVNTYDDGLSTGQIRRFIPGLLGPSDIRKNVSSFIPVDDVADQSLRRIIEFRLPRTISAETALLALRQMADELAPKAEPTLAKEFANLRLCQARQAGRYAAAFLDHYEAQAPECRRLLDFPDCSVGNILFAGCYLTECNDFNQAVRAFSEAWRITTNILNVTDGKNAVLVGLKCDGEYLHDEASIVSEQSKSPIKEVFLLPDYLSAAETETLRGMSLAEAQSWLGGRQIFPKLNPEARVVLAEADLIVYGPGTQHSSLLPSYLTAGLGALIAANRNAEKIFISNIATDHEIQGETANTLVDKVLHYVNAKGTTSLAPSDLITKALLQTGRDAPPDGFACDPHAAPFTDIKPIVTDWRDEGGRHAAARILDELSSIVNDRRDTKIGRCPYMVSIIVPGLDEERTVRDVLLQLSLVDFDIHGLKREILYVDGGSRDRSVELAKSVAGVRVLQLEGATGRGSALRLGVEKSIGNLIAFFHSDGEYDATDLVRLVGAVVNSDTQIAFGSRTIKCMNMSGAIREIYKNNYFGYLASMYGGLSISALTLLLHNRFVTDPFTGIKVFDAGQLREFRLKSRGLDLETEIIAKACLRRTHILELPVQYSARTRQQGKKTTVFGGIQALWRLVRVGTFEPIVRGLAARLGMGREVRIDDATPRMIPIKAWPLVQDSKPAAAAAAAPVPTSRAA